MALSDLKIVGRDEASVRIVADILKQRFGERFQTGLALREQHAHTTTYIPVQAPDGVVFPDTTEEVQEIVAACAQYRVPVIPFGVGSSLEGQVNAPGGGISIDTSRMNRILAVHPEDLDCVIEPGVTRIQLNEYLRDTGLFFPIDPGANASLGGMAVDPRLGHQRGALRHDARERAVAERCDGGWLADLDRQAGEEEFGRLRPDAAAGRLGGDARRHHVADAEALRHTAGDLGRRVPVPERRGGLPGNDRDDPDGRAGGADRTRQPAADEGDDRLFQARLSREPVPLR